MTDARRRLLEALGAHGALAEQLAERYGEGYAEELAAAITDEDVRVRQYDLEETTGSRFAAELPLRSYHLTRQGAKKIGVDPHTLIG